MELGQGCDSGAEVALGSERLLPVLPRTEYAVAHEWT